MGIIIHYCGGTTKIYWLFHVVSSSRVPSTEGFLLGPEKSVAAPAQAPQAPSCEGDQDPMPRRAACGLFSWRLSYSAKKPAIKSAMIKSDFIKLQKCVLPHKKMREPVDHPSLACGPSPLKIPSDHLLISRRSNMSDQQPGVTVWSLRAITYHSCYNKNIYD